MLALCGAATMERVHCHRFTFAKLGKTNVHILTVLLEVEGIAGSAEQVVREVYAIM